MNGTNFYSFDFQPCYQMRTIWEKASKKGGKQTGRQGKKKRPPCSKAEQIYSYLYLNRYLSISVPVRCLSKISNILEPERRNHGGEMWNSIILEHLGISSTWTSNIAAMDIFSIPPLSNIPHHCNWHSAFQKQRPAHSTSPRGASPWRLEPQRMPPTPRSCWPPTCSIMSTTMAGLQRSHNKRVFWWLWFERFSAWSSTVKIYSPMND